MFLRDVYIKMREGDIVNISFLPVSIKKLLRNSHIFQKEDVFDEWQEEEVYIYIHQRGFIYIINQKVVFEIKESAIPDVSNRKFLENESFSINNDKSHDYFL